MLGKHKFINWRVYFQNLLNPLLVLLRKTGFFDRIYTQVYMGKQNLDLKKMYLRELSGFKFHSVTSSNVILYNDVKNSISSKVDLSGFGNELFNWYIKSLLDSSLRNPWVRKIGNITDIQSLSELYSCSLKHFLQNRILIMYVVTNSKICLMICKLACLYGLLAKLSVNCKNKCFVCALCVCRQMCWKHINEIKQISCCACCFFSELFILCTVAWH